MPLLPRQDLFERIGRCTTCLDCYRGLLDFSLSHFSPGTGWSASWQRGCWAFTWELPDCFPRNLDEVAPAHHWRKAAAPGKLPLLRLFPFVAKGSHLPTWGIFKFLSREVAPAYHWRKVAVARRLLLPRLFPLVAKGSHSLMCGVFKFFWQRLDAIAPGVAG